MSCFFQHRGRSVHPIRQQGPHVHQAVADKSGGHVLVADLGLDEISVYGTDWENGHLIPDKARAIRTAPGMGPRQCVFNEAGTRLYVLCELGNAVCAFDYDSRTGGARLLQTVSTLPPGCEAESIAACVKLHPNGELLFASNRGHDSIAAYRVDEGGLLALIHVVSSGGRTPRDFDISPDGEFLIAGNQESDELVIFRIDGENGGLKEIGRQHCGSVTAVLIADIEV
jgi:6-phosphogluconolactonase